VIVTWSLVMTQSRRDPGPHHIFGLSIDEQVQWATALTDGKGGVQFNTIRVGTFEDIRIAGPERPDFDLQKKLTEALTFLKQSPEMFKAVGVSTIGVVDPAEKLLLSIARKNWFPGEPSQEDDPQPLRPHLVNFKELFGKDLGIVSVQEDERKLNVHNETTAAALAEYFKQREQRELSKLVYLRFDEGVNGGIIINASALASQLNVELGHLYPPRHQYDRDFLGVCPHTAEKLPPCARLPSRRNTRGRPVL
jgi:hypothetical protein